ncbi:MAG: 2-oxoacid:acceptor oxidoreductase family protein [Smithellaceae bacterium]|nr:2-oxoacid:acceptor oxidoreductase family protein [Smithellaceae bacterium]
MYEIIWHGRGGQGVVVVAHILAEAAYLQGYKGVTSAPTFGPERRGAPVTASTRIADEPIRTYAQIEKADIAVVLDPSLLRVVNVLGSLKENGLLIINTHQQKPEQLGLNGSYNLAIVDAVSIALRHELIREGAPVVNTPLLGSFARAAGLVSLECLEKGLAWKLSGGVLAANILALKAAYEETRLKAEDFPSFDLKP